MASFNKFNAFVQGLGSKDMNLTVGQDTLKVALLNTIPTATMVGYADLLGEIADVDNGYTAGGTAVANTDYTNTAGTSKLVGDDVVFTQAGANPMGPFQYVVLYDDSATGKDLIGWWNHGSAVTLVDGETFTVDFSAVNGILTIA